MSIQTNKQLIRNAFRDVIENSMATEATIKQYFAEDYIQHVDGQTLNFEQFMAHMQAQKAVVESASVRFVHLVAEGDKVCSVHEVTAIKKNGTHLKAKLVALFQIRDQKIILCDELTHLIEGDAVDRDLGFRH